MASHFLAKISKQQGKKIQGFHEKLLEYFQQRQWDGNVRELENVVERLVAIASTDAEIIDLNILPAEIRTEVEYAPGTEGSLQAQLQQVETDILKKALLACNWNQSKAARQIGISERNIRFRMEKLNIQRPEKS